MDVKEAIQNRRAYLSLIKVPIDTELITDLAECAKIAPSCYNNQPLNKIMFLNEYEV
jgi:nitroreductase